MKTLQLVNLGEHGTAESTFDWDVQADGKRLSMHIDAVVADGDILSWEDQFALLDAAWLALVDVRRAERRHTRRMRVKIA